MIAYDLRFASDHFAGIGRHAHALIQSLLELPGNDRYLLLWDPDARTTRFDLDALRTHPRVTWVERRIPALSPPGVLGLGRLLRALAPDVYLSPFNVRPLAAGCPVVITIHDLWPLRLPEGLSPFRRWIYRWMISDAVHASAIITVSEFSRREILELTRARAEQVRAILNGVAPPLSPVEPRRPAALPDRPFALAVGDNRPRKNLRTLARAWALLGPNPPLELVSAGPIYDRYPSLARLGVEAGASGITTLGWVAEDELDWLYRNAELVLFPTLYEGFGFPLVEAFVRGRPAVVADIPVLREVGGAAAETVEPENPEAWKSAVSRLLGNPAERERLIAAGAHRAAELSYRQCARSTLDLLREVARPSRPRTG